MYEVKAIVRLDRQEDVIAALHAVPDLPGLTISMVEGVGRRHVDAVLEPADFGRAPMAKIEIVVGEDRLSQVLDAVTRSARTGRRSNFTEKARVDFAILEGRAICPAQRR